MTLIGKEDHSAHFEKGKAAFETNAGFDEMDTDKPVQELDEKATIDKKEVV